MKKPKIDKTKVVVKVKRPRGRPPLNPKPDTIQHVVIHPKVKKLKKKLKLKSTNITSSTKLNNNPVLKKSISASAIPHVPSKLLASTSSKGVPPPIVSNANISSKLMSSTPNSGSGYGMSKSQSLALTSSKMSQSKKYNTNVNSNSSTVATSTFSSSNTTMTTLKMASHIVPISNTTSTTPSTTGGKLTTKESRQAVYPVHRILSKLMIDEPLPITVLTHQLIDIPKEIIQATLDILQILGIVIRVKAASTSNTSSSAAVATKESNLLYTLNHHAKSSDIVDISNMVNVTAMKRQNAILIRSRNQALYVSSFYYFQYNILLFFSPFKLFFIRV